MPDGKISSEEEQAGWSHEPCRPSRGGWIGKFCSECGGPIEEDRVHGQAFCGICGLAEDNYLIFKDPDPLPSYWIDPIRKAKQNRYEKTLEECEKKVGISDEEEEAAKNSNDIIDRRVAAIIESFEGSDRITNLELVHGVMPKICNRYIAAYGDISRDKVRNSYNRFKKHQKKRVARLIKKLLTAAFNPDRERLITVRSWQNEIYRPIKEKNYPCDFIYKGTLQTRREPNWEESFKVEQKMIMYSRRKEVLHIISNPRKAPIIITKSYESDGITKQIIFEVKPRQIWMYGKDIDNHFEDFFFEEALKLKLFGKLPKCPGTRKGCVGVARAVFKERFSRVCGFRKHGFYDARPYLPQPNNVFENGNIATG